LTPPLERLPARQVIDGLLTVGDYPDRVANPRLTKRFLLKRNVLRLVLYLQNPKFAHVFVRTA